MVSLRSFFFGHRGRGRYAEGAEEGGAALAHLSFFAGLNGAQIHTEGIQHCLMDALGPWLLALSP